MKRWDARKKCPNEIVCFTPGGELLPMPQMQLPFFPHGATEINVNLAIIREGDKVTYIYGHLPIFTHDVRDTRTFRMFISQLYVNGSVSLPSCKWGTV